MKKFLQFFIMVVVALISGFPQHSMGQVLPCKKIPLEFIYSDSTFWVKDSIQIVSMVKKAEEYANKGVAIGQNKRFVFPLSFIRIVTDTNYGAGQGGLNYHKHQPIGFLFPYIGRYKQKHFTDTNAITIYLGDSRMFTTNIPTFLSAQWQICNPRSFWYLQISAIVKYDSISTRFDHPFYAMILCHTIFDLLGVGNEAQKGVIMTSDLLNIGDSITAVTVSNINNRPVACKQTVVCTTGSLDVGNTSDDILIEGQTIINGDHHPIRVYDLYGRQLLFSSDYRISLQEISPGLVIIQSERKKGIKHLIP